MAGADVRADIAGIQGLRPLELPPLTGSPLCSVLVTSYNYGRYVGEALASILDQTYPHFEVIVCDDGSTDESCELIARFARQDARVQLVSKRNGGLASALNAAFDHAAGVLIAYFDMDDLWLPQRLETVVRAFQEHPAAGMVTHQVDWIDGSGRVLCASWPPALRQGWLAPQLLQGESLIFPAFYGTLRREIADLVFPLPDRRELHADQLIHVRACMLAPVVGVEQVLALYRRHDANMSGSGQGATLPEIDSLLASRRMVVHDAARFVRDVHGIVPDPALVRCWERGAIGKASLIRALMGGEPPSPQEILAATGGRHYWWWRLLLLAPPPLSRYLYNLWCHYLGPLSRLLLPGG